MASPSSVLQREVQYLTKDGDVLDLICWNYYGVTKSVVEKVLRRNRPLLTTYQAILPAGLVIVLPQITLPVAEGFKLWDYRQASRFKAMAAQTQDSLVAVQADLARYRSLRNAGQVSDQPTIPTVYPVGRNSRIIETDDGGLAIDQRDKTGKWKRKVDYEP
jgi:phage tail protein X